MKWIYRAFISLSILSLAGCAGNQNAADQKQNMANTNRIRNTIDRNNQTNNLEIRSTQRGNVNQINTGDSQGLSKEYHGHFSNRPEENRPKGKPPAVDNHYIQVQLLGINDLHGQLDVTRKVNGKPVGRVDYLASYLKQRAAQNKNTIMVHAGDMVGASPPISSLLQDEPTIEILNKLNYGIGTVGNHEFDKGVQQLHSLLKGGTIANKYFAGANFPNIVANVVDAKNGNPILTPYKVLKIHGIPIGFIGVVTTDTPIITMPSNVAGVKFIDEVEAINRYVPELKRHGVRSIVVLAHDPGTSDINGANPTGKLVDMANRVDNEVDIIFGGHNHAYMNATINNKLVVQAYSYGTAFSDVYLQIDPRTKDIVSKKADIVTTFQDGMTPDPEIKKMVDGYAAKVAPQVNRVIGTTSSSLTALQNANGESILGDLISDSQRNAMKTDFAFMNPGGIRADLDSGDITWGQAYTVQPFNNALVKMTMTGQQIRDVLNQQWKDSSATMLQISGFTYTWDANHPAGQKVTSILLPDKTPIDPNKTYTVTANAFLASGGDGFTVFNQGQNRVTGPIDLDAFVNYLGTLQKPFTYSTDNRILKVQY